MLFWAIGVSIFVIPANNSEQRPPFVEFARIITPCHLTLRYLEQFCNITPYIGNIVATSADAKYSNLRAAAQCTPSLLSP